MKLYQVFVAAVVTALVGVVAFSQLPASAWSERMVSSDGDVRVDASERPDGSLYVVPKDGEAIITGEVKGNLYCAGKSIRIKADVEGSIYCAGSTIEVDGAVDGNVVVAAQAATVGGDIAGDVSVFAESFRLSESAIIEGDLNGAGSKFTLDGQVEGGILAAVNSLNINNVVGSLDVVAQSISLGSSAKVAGDVNFRPNSNNSINIDESKVGGDIKMHEAAASPGFASYFTSAFTFAFIGILSLVIVTMVPFSRHYRRVSAKISGKLPIVFLVGFVALFAMPVSLVLLAITLVGIPLAAMVGALWVALMIVGAGYSVYTVATSLQRASGRLDIWMAFGLAVLILSLVIALPAVGAFAVIIGLVFGAGSILLTFFGGDEDVADKPRKSTAPKVKLANSEGESKKK